MFSGILNEYCFSSFHDGNCVIVSATRAPLQALREAYGALFVYDVCLQHCLFVCLFVCLNVCLPRRRRGAGLRSFAPDNFFTGSMGASAAGNALSNVLENSGQAGTFSNGEYVKPALFKISTYMYK